MYLWILIKDTLFSLQQNDLFFLPELARFKGESKDKGKEKKKRRMETKMGLSKCRIILGKKSDRESRVWSCPQGSRYGWAHLACCRDERLMHSYEQNISSVCGVRLLLTLAAPWVKKLGTFFESLTKLFLPVTPICPTYLGLSSQVRIKWVPVKQRWWWWWKKEGQECVLGIKHKFLQYL